MSQDGVSVVHMGEWVDPATRGEFVRRLGEGLEQLGFVCVTGHGVPAELLDVAYAQARLVFALPLATKQRYETPANGRQRGYTSRGVEHAMDTMVPDL